MLTKTTTMMEKKPDKKIKRSYLICFDNYTTDRDTVLATLDRVGLRTWRTELPGCIMLKTVASPKAVSDVLVKIMRQHPFIVAEISGKRSGRLSQKGWDFLADSKDSEVRY